MACHDRKIINGLTRPVVACMCIRRSFALWSGNFSESLELGKQEETTGWRHGHASAMGDAAVHLPCQSYGTLAPRCPSLRHAPRPRSLFSQVQQQRSQHSARSDWRRHVSRPLRLTAAHDDWHLLIGRVRVRLHLLDEISGDRTPAPQRPAELMGRRITVRVDAKQPNTPA